MDFSLTLSISLWYVGRISEAAESFKQTIILDEQNRNTPEFQNVAKFQREFCKQAHICLPDFLQGFHAPERQSLCQPLSI